MRRQMEEAEQIPPGMRLLPEGERLEMLARLKESRAETEKQMQRLPFVCETPSQTKRKTELETRISVYNARYPNFHPERHS